MGTLVVTLIVLVLVLVFVVLQGVFTLAHLGVQKQSALGAGRLIVLVELVRELLRLRLESELLALFVILFLIYRVSFSFFD